jgi:predicted Ser/Thr protein kinase
MESMFGRYQVVRVLGRGSFGTVYHVRVQDRESALKVEPLTAPRNMLKLEHDTLALVQGCPGFPALYSYSKDH